MATLFFEGFDKGIIFNQLDTNYWSSQFKQFPKYSFGGYLPVFDGNNSYNLMYTSNSPNNGILATGQYLSYGIIYQPSIDNSYPGFGKPPGFLALSNIEIENSVTQEYPTYLQMSGFSQPSGDICYFSMRCLGLESKHMDYSDYPHRHNLLSFNSGNNSHLLVNIVKITGNTNLLTINGKHETLALEIQQNNETIGYFDLNISDILNRYKISSINNSDNKILSITDSNLFYGNIPISRWSHLEISIDQSTETPELYINLEDVNLQVIDFDTENDRVDWVNSLPISGFEFNNIRLYNRTYSSSISSGWLNNNSYPLNTIAPTVMQNYYYLFGKVFLVDDIALIDNSNPEPSYWLGSSARVIQLVPGASYYDGTYGVNRTYLIDNSFGNDGLLEWTPNSIVYTSSNNSGPTNPVTSHRRGFSFLDNDNSIVETISSGNIDAVRFIPRTPVYFNSIFNSIESFTANSLWRETFNEAIGGIKIYNSARKKYLDTKFMNVFLTGNDRLSRSNYTNIGPEHNVDKTTYKTYQYFSFQNPATQQNWTVSELSGIIFGVKKL